MADTNGPVTTNFPGVNPSSTPQVYGASAATISIPQVVPSSAELAVTESNLGTISFTTIIDVRQTAGSYPAINKNASFQKQVPVTPLGPQFTITPGTLITPSIQGPPPIAVQAIQPIKPFIQVIQPITPFIQEIKPGPPIAVQAIQPGPLIAVQAIQPGPPIAVQEIQPGPPIAVQAIQPITPFIQPITPSSIRPIKPGPPIAVQEIQPITPFIQQITPSSIQPIKPGPPIAVQAIQPITPTFDIQPTTTTTTTTTETSTKQPIALYVTPETVGDITLPEPLR